MPRAEPSCGRAGVRASAIALVALVALAGRVHAAGPLIVNGAGTPLAWSAGVVTWNPDRGTLGTLSNAGAVDLVAGNFATWQAVPTAALAIYNGGSLPVRVEGADCPVLLLHARPLAVCELRVLAIPLDGLGVLGVDEAGPVEALVDDFLRVRDKPCPLPPPDVFGEDVSRRPS